MGKAWGESLSANFGVGLIVFLLFLVAIIPAILGILAGGVMLIIGMVITVLLLMVLALVSSAANTIIVAALYQYAAQDRVPQQFDVDILRGAFSKK